MPDDISKATRPRTGDGVRALRASLGLTTGELAALVGVAPSTVGRWERYGATRAKIDPTAERLVEALAAAAATCAPAELGLEVRGALLCRGGLFALYLVLRRVFAT